MNRHRQLPLGETLKAAFAKLPLAWRGAWGAILVCAVVWSVAGWSANAVEASWAMIGRGVGQIAGLAAGLALAGGLTRIAVSADLDEARRRGLGPAGLQFGWPELRLLGAALLCAVFMAMILSVAALLLLALFGMAGLDAEAINQRNWVAVGPVWKLVLLAVVTLLVAYGVLVMAVRLSLFAPATLGRGHMVSLSSMGVAQGSFWPLLGGLIVVGLPKLVLIGLSAAGLLSGAARDVVSALILSGLEAPLAAVFLGEAYQRLEYWAPDARDPG